MVHGDGDDDHYSWGWDTRKNLLFLCYAITAHPLASVVELVHNVLRDDVAGADNAQAHGDGRPVAAKPSPRCSEHDGEGLML